jgi:hypothetical protein
MHKITGKRFKVLACRSMWREVSLLASRSPNVCDIEFLPLGLHNDPPGLRQTLQEKIHATSPQKMSYQQEGLEFEYDYDAIVLAYGLCSNGTEGLSSKRYQLVIPRVHDCISLLLGSSELYHYYFEKHRGIYWYSSGWIEHSIQPSRERRELVYQIFKNKFGEENAAFLMQLEDNWQREYSRAIYISWGFPVDEKYCRFTQECAEFLGWEFEEVRGNPKLLSDLLNGVWDEERFLIVKPGEVIEASGDKNIFCKRCVVD